MQGFYTALGTPLDSHGDFIVESFKKQIEDQIEAGACGVLAIGSMGIQPCIKDADCRRVAEAAVEAAKGRCHLTVGVMDNSISRVVDRIDALSGLKIDGVVVTTPFYFMANQRELKTFFESIASRSPYPVYLYDLPTVTKTKIDYALVSSLMSIHNIKGIKTADMVLSRTLMNDPNTRDDFDIFCSNLDLVDFAYRCGLKVGLDGMFAMTAPVISNAYKALHTGDYERASKLIDNILGMRSVMAEVGIFPGFTHAMNLLGYEGRFQPDYAPMLDDMQKEKIRSAMQSFGIL